MARVEKTGVVTKAVSSHNIDQGIYIDRQAARFIDIAK